MEVVKEKIYTVKDNIKRKAISYNWHESIVSYLEAIFARGDRRLCEVLIKLMKKGAKFDGWSEYFNFDIWMEAFIECGLMVNFYAYRERSYEEVLPWDFIDIGIKKQFLIDENEKAKSADLTPDAALVAHFAVLMKTLRKGSALKVRYAIKFSKESQIKFISHLDLMRTIQKNNKESSAFSRIF